MAGNKNVIMIMGLPSSGKTYSLKYLPNQDKWAYLNCDLKDITFKSPKFLANKDVDDAMTLPQYIDLVENTPEIEGAVIDTLTYFMNMFERQYVKTARDTQKMWGEYGDMYCEVMHKIKSGTKSYVVLAHEMDVMTTKGDGETIHETKVPVKGAVGKRGVEGDFSIILRACRMPVQTLDKYPNDLLHITERERRKKVKYVFQTDITTDTLNHKIRVPEEMFREEELWIDNDMGQVITRIHAYNNDLDY